MTALAVAAGGLVSAAVIGVAPARADHCDPAQASQDDGRRQRDRAPDQQAPDQQDPDQQAPDQQNPDQQAPDQQAPDQQFPDQQRPDQQAPDRQGRGGDRQVQGSGIVLRDPARSPEPEDSGDALFRRDRSPRTPTAAPQDPQNPRDPQDPQDPQNPQDPQDPQNPQDPQDPGDQSQDRRGRPTRTASPSPTASQDDDCKDLGPFVTDFVDIRQVQPLRLDAGIGRNGSRGTFVAQCGTNRNGHNNPDNFIVAPGVSNGAHHLHDYVGNLSTDGFSTDESLAAAGTTCRLGDKSTYFWPVLRDRKVDANVQDPDGNVGRVIRAGTVSLQFRGNATSRVVAMPRFLRLITGDAKAGTNGAANARARWSCTGFTNRISPDKYPLCPRGSQVLRILDFPSCWDGQNTDSANHRTHVVFPGQNGACPQGTRAIPQLRMLLAYTVPQGPSFAVDAFPEQKHNPVTDHADFANVMPERLMQFVVSCINRGRRC
ncbi:DUF1996 domain-containing protein [Nonomuraea sp. NPDC001023]|uniref:DUF1996 domain-containing protein n=1 Tax=unclassified Nonomuraea TaxID=2593643 RepID=UPI00331CB5C7